MAQLSLFISKRLPHRSKVDQLATSARYCQIPKSGGISWSVAFHVPRMLSEPLSRSEYGFRPQPTRKTDLRMLGFHLIEQAHKDAKGTNRARASEAIHWLRTDVDYTRIARRHIVVPQDIREGFTFSFQWCCAVLSWDANKVRAEGMPIPPSERSQHYRWAGLEGDGLRRNWRQWRDERKRAQQLLDARSRRRVERLTRMAAARAQAQQNQHVIERPLAMAVSV